MDQVTVFPTWSRFGVDPSAFLIQFVKEGERFACVSEGGEEVDFAAERCSSSSSSSSHPPLPPSTSSLDAEQTQCSVREITRLINANKQTTAQRQPQMKADLYLINKRRSSFNLPVCPARCRSTPPSFTSTHLLHPSLPPAPHRSLRRVAGLGSQARKTA